MNFFGKTDIGKTRTANQDSFFAGYLCDMQDNNRDNNPLLFVVCDGMGGAAGGKIASSVAVDTFVSNVKQLYYKKQYETYEQLLSVCAQRANLTVFSRSTTDENLSGMGTTLTAALVTDDRICVVNVGDSRVYAIKNKKIKQITKDHSYVQELLDGGQISPEQAKKHPNKNIITRALGSKEKVEADTFTIVEKTDGIVLCSDGLCNHVDDTQILNEFYITNDTENICQNLIDLANSGGGRDNITVVAVSFLQ